DRQAGEVPSDRADPCDTVCPNQPPVHIRSLPVDAWWATRPDETAGAPPCGRFRDNPRRDQENTNPRCGYSGAPTPRTRSRPGDALLDGVVGQPVAPCGWPSGRRVSV